MSKFQVEENSRQKEHAAYEKERYPNVFTCGMLTPVESDGEQCCLDVEYIIKQSYNSIQMRQTNKGCIKEDTVTRC